jgi:hypothetical protein
MHLEITDYCSHDLGIDDTGCPALSSDSHVESPLPFPFVSRLLGATTAILRILRLHAAFHHQRRWRASTKVSDRTGCKRLGEAQYIHGFLRAQGSAPNEDRFFMAR